jgi:putative oxidoreductase
MNFATVTARILLGSIFVIFGLNGFLQFLPQPAMPQPAVAFFGGLAASGFMLPTLFATQVVGGAVLLLGMVPLALVILAPVVGRPRSHRS